MATATELVPRVLRKIKVLAAGEVASAEDAQLVEEKLRAVHASLKTHGLLRWTLQDIPDYAEEPYVMMCAFLVAPDFSQVAEPAYWSIGLSEIQAAVSLKAAGVVRAEYF